MNSLTAPGAHRSVTSGSSAYAATVKSLQSRAYVSPIQVRKMIRTAPDLQSRIKLRELQDKLAEDSRNAKTKSKKNAGSRKEDGQMTGSREYAKSTTTHRDNPAVTSKAHSSHDRP
jgi:hypothetical protein